MILQDLGSLEEAEVFIRKSIEIKSDFAEAHFILGNILKNLGKLKESEISYLKAIDFKPEFAKAYFSLSNLEYSMENDIWQKYLFSETILNSNL